MNKKETVLPKEQNEDGWPKDKTDNPAEDRGESSLLLIQSELTAPKSNYNKFGEFSYRSCEDILEGLKPLLLKYHSMLHLTDDIKEIGGHLYVIATANFVDQYGVKFTSKAFARETMQKPKMGTEQLTGSASSYARKYALNGLFLIDDAKDPDSDDNSKEPSKQENKQQSEPQGKAFTKDEIPEFMKKWNGKLYGNSVFFNGEKYILDKKQVEWIKTQDKYKPDNK